MLDSCFKWVFFCDQPINITFTISEFIILRSNRLEHTFKEITCNPKLFVNVPFDGKFR